MSKRMLIDASHPEETRVVIVDGSRVEELDFESAQKRQIRGNLYLARVTRVEPSLQAAFVEYGGNRHGFLAFSEIHPDYYQIPYEDRMAILEDEEAEVKKGDNGDNGANSKSSDSDEDISDNENTADDEDVEEEQDITANERRARIRRRKYKIQEVIKRGQILLIQAVKEERGNKGAAMTTYLSLAGRYCVLMPNTPRGGGISRKISNGGDRKRLKEIVSGFDVPQGMGVIIRTAGASRTKAEVKRDYDYLSRLWGTIRETTLKSIAPALIHEEGNLVKRSIRDLYNKEIKEVLVQGDDAYKTAKSFIKMLMPSHAKNVKAYKDDIPLFTRYQAESQIESSLDAVVQLKSGGYLVIHPTEALVSIDINSGRSTKERNVERTALKTNLEAADEIARQMRLRDLAGLIVIDFIDMDENRNNRSVEKRMRDALSQDRARVQAGRISQFGLMEISRQRRRRSLLEGSTTPCPHCMGVGRKRTIESAALQAIRAAEEYAVRGQAKRAALKVPSDVALYIFNYKRELLSYLENSHDLFVELVSEDSLMRSDFEIEVIEKSDKGSSDPLKDIEKELKKEDRESQSQRKSSKSKSSKKSRIKNQDDSDADTSDDSDNESDEDKTSQASDEDSGSKSGRKRRRRGRRGGRRRKSDNNDTQQSDASSDNDNASDESSKEDVPDALEVIVPESTADLPGGDDSDGQKAEDAKPKKTRRRSRKAKSETVEVKQTDSGSQDQAPQDTAPTSSDDGDNAEPEAEIVRSTTRRKAPGKPKSKPATKKKAAPKAAAKKPARKIATRSSSRRKAPGKPAAPQADSEAAE